MTEPIRWKPQRMSPQGDIIAESFLKLLSRGSDTGGLSEPELLVRETAQNTWDARRSGDVDPPSMDFRVQHLTDQPDLRTALRRFFAGVEEATRVMGAMQTCIGKLQAILNRDDMSLLYVRDIGTWGLGGPTDASIAVAEPGTDRYVKFMLNIGDPNADTRAGGAYGLGRSVFWRTSECSTVIVYSRCATNGGIESRLIGLSLGGKFQRDDRNYTGRHWWVADEEGKPLLGHAADDWAKALGFELYPAGTTGTSVLVVAPHAPGGGEDLALAIARSIELHLWPKYTQVARRAADRTMRFSVRLGARSIEVRDRVALGRTRLAQYIDAFEQLLLRGESNGDEDHDEIGTILKSTHLRHDFRRNRHPNELGVLATKIFVDAAPLSPPPDDAEDGLAQVVERKMLDLGNSVALMRSPELVVTYKSFSHLMPAGVRFAGVFKSSEDANDFFRRSETSTHSEWDDRVCGHDDGVVIRVFHSTLRKKIDDWHVVPAQQAEPTDDILPAEKVATLLGEMMSDWEAGEGDVPGRPDETGGRGSAGGGGGDRRHSGGRGHRDLLNIRPVSLVEDDGAVFDEWIIDVVHRGRVELELALLIADDDGVSSIAPDVGPGRRPTFILVESTAEFSIGGDSPGIRHRSFPAGPETNNVTECILTFDPAETETEHSVEVTVRVGFDEGTVPILMADIGPAVSARKAP